MPDFLNSNTLNMKDLFKNMIRPIVIMGLLGTAGTMLVDTWLGLSINWSQIATIWIFLGILIGIAIVVTHLKNKV